MLFPLAYLLLSIYYLYAVIACTQQTNMSNIIIIKIWHNYNIKNWMWDQYGEKNRISGSLSTGSLDPITPSLGASIGLSEKYGQVVNMDENFDLKKGRSELIAFSLNCFSRENLRLLLI